MCSAINEVSQQESGCVKSAQVGYLHQKKVQNWCTAVADSQQYCRRFLVQGLQVQPRRALERITLRLPLRPIPDFTPPAKVISILLRRAALHRWRKTVAGHWRVTSGCVWGVLCMRPLFAYVWNTSLPVIHVCVLIRPLWSSRVCTYHTEALCAFFFPLCAFIAPLPLRSSL